MICIYESDDICDDPASASSVYFPELIKILVKLLTDRFSRAGSMFDIDLRLRPHGSSGLEATSFSHFNSYYSLSGNAQQFERQALIRLRFVAGDQSFGKIVEVARDAFVYSCQYLDIENAVHLRQRQRDELCKPLKVNVKYSKGGLLDIEYAVQYLQLVHGHACTEIRCTNVLETLDKLFSCQLISHEDHLQIHVTFFLCNLPFNSLIQLFRMLICV